MTANNSFSKEEYERKLSTDIEKILDSGLSVIEHENKSETRDRFKVSHLSIIGGARRVEYYPSSGSCYANRIKGKFRAARGSGVYDAIRIAKKGK